MLRTRLLPYCWMLLASLSLALMGELAHALRSSCGWQLVALSRSLLCLILAVAFALAGGKRLVLWRPRSFPLVAGLLLCAALAANAAAALNHPALVELMDLEYEQRQLILTQLTQSKENVANVLAHADDYALPVVVMMPSGSGIRGSLYHSHSFESWATRLTGWKVVMPSNALDAYGLMLSAIADPTRSWSCCPMPCSA